LKPVAWLPKWAHDRLTGQLGSVSDPVTWGINTHIYAESTPETVPLYTAPPRKPWVSLSDEQKKEATAICKAPWHSWAVDPIALCNYVEAKLKEKNT